MNEDAILARIGTAMTVTQSEVEEMIAVLASRGKNFNTPDGRKAILNQLVSQKLMLCDAVRNLYEREPAFKEELRKTKDELLVNYATEKVISGVRVTDAEVRQFYNEHESEIVGEETVNASHILLDNEDLANELLGKLNAGEIAFEDAARQYSTCPSKEEGGNLGEFGRGQMVPEFDQAVFEMEEGELRGPVHTQFGYHLIRLNKKNAPVKPTFDEIKDQLRAQLLNEKRQAAYQSKLNQLRILYPVEFT